MSDAVIPERNEPPSEQTGAEGGIPAGDTPNALRKSVAAVKVHPAKEASGAKKVNKLVGVRVPSAGMVYRFVSTLREIQVGDAVLLQDQEEETVGWVVFVVEGQAGELFQDRLFPGGFEKIIRVLSENERDFLHAREGLEHQARKVCREKIRELQLPMRLSKVHYLPGGGKVVVYFTAESRVDFRELVRLLGSQLKVRVEMRHIGVRDETKLLGGIGLCGHEFCCRSYLERFHPVSVRMAKNQELSLNPEGISGTCGRLLCCLEYENATYQALREGLPRLKQSVQALDGREGVVQAVHPLMGTVDVQLGDGSRACFGQCDLCGGGEKGGVVPEEGLPEEGAAGTEEAARGAVSAAKKRPAEPSAPTRGAATTGRRAPPRREAPEQRTRPGAGGVPVVVDAGVTPVPKGGTPLLEVPAVGAPVPGIADGQAPAKKRRRRRRSATGAATEKKETP
ncbi:MAG: hypothetical protein HQL87_02415 [Magnetococcales bacterium]|nr:hypothetical protein [Magnetococcales bacterium]